jgi:alkylation response protein AidB-like acyl-CoA dehydrogenase
VWTQSAPTCAPASSSASGSFQALQHKAAMLLVNSELATAAPWDAVRAATESREQHRLAATTAAVIGIAPAPDLVLETTTDRADRAITTTSRRDRSGI